MRLGAGDPSVRGHLLWPLPPVVATEELRAQAQAQHPLGIPAAAWPLVLSAVGSESLGQNNHAPVIFQRLFVTTELPISKQHRVKIKVLLLNLETSSVLFPLAQGPDRCWVSPGGFGPSWAHVGSCRVMASVGI